MALRVGLIGCGFIGRFHSAAIRAIANRRLLDVEYVVVCDRNVERAQSFAALTGARVETDGLLAAEAPDVDAVFICVPTAGHKELVMAAVARGKPVFCEKPLATNLAAVEEMVAAVDEAGVPSGVGLVLRHSPVLTVLKELIDDGSLGRMMAIVLRDDQFFPVTGHYGSDWRKDKEIAGAGTLLEHSIHDVDVLSWFGGEVNCVTGTTRNFAGHEGVEDVAVVRLEFESGAQASLVSVWHSVMGRPSTRRIEVFMEKGVFWTDHDFLGPIHYQVHASNPTALSEDEVRSRYLEIVGARTDDLRDFLHYSFQDYAFLRSVIDGSVPHPGFHTALAAHRVVDAIYRSASSGGQVVPCGP